jgi:hypothetical protein
MPAWSASSAPSNTSGCAIATTPLGRPPSTTSSITSGSITAYGSTPPNEMSTKSGPHQCGVCTNFETAATSYTGAAESIRLPRICESTNMVKKAEAARPFHHHASSGQSRTTPAANRATRSRAFNLPSRNPA